MSSKQTQKDDLHERVSRFKALLLSERPIWMSIETAYLIDNLDKRVQQLEIENYELQKNLDLRAANEALGDLSTMSTSELKTQIATNHNLSPEVDYFD